MIERFITILDHEKNNTLTNLEECNTWYKENFNEGLSLNITNLIKEKYPTFNINEDNLKKAKEELKKIESDANIKYLVCDVTKKSDIEGLINYSKKAFSNFHKYSSIKLSCNIRY